jgi:hypothetical protein
MATFTPEGYVPPKGAGLNLAWFAAGDGQLLLRRQGIPIIRGRDFHPGRQCTTRRWLSSSIAPSRSITGPARTPSASACIAARYEAPTPWLTVVGEIGDVKAEYAPTCRNELPDLSCPPARTKLRWIFRSHLPIHSRQHRLHRVAHGARLSRWPIRSARWCAPLIRSFRSPTCESMDTRGELKARRRAASIRRLSPALPRRRCCYLCSASTA